MDIYYITYIFQRQKLNSPNFNGEKSKSNFEQNIRNKTWVDIAYLCFH